MDNHEQWLRLICNTDSGPYLRPFAPNSHWRTADVFIVGTNPATPLRPEFSSFDEYWHGLTVDKAVFEAKYRAKRGDKKKSTKTTERASKFIENLRPLNILTTNAIAYPIEKADKIPDKKHQKTLGRDIFDRLVQLCRPKAILFHGQPAIELGKDYFQLELNRDIPILEQNTTAIPIGLSNPIKLFAYPHFSGLGAKGFKVSGMDVDLSHLADRIRKELI